MTAELIEPIASTDVTSKQRPQFSKVVGITLVTRLFMLVGALGTSIIVGRWVGPEGVGTLAVINVTLALTVQLGCVGLPSANTYLISRDRDSLGNVWANSLAFASVAGALFAFALFAAARSHVAAFGNVSPSLISIAAVSLPFQFLTLLGLNLFLGLGQINRFNIIDAALQLALLFNAMLALIVLRLGISRLVLLNTAIAILGGLAVAIMMRRFVRRLGIRNKWFDPATFRRMIQYGLKFHVALVAAVVIVRADVLLVNHFRGANEAGVYAVAGQMANLLMLLPAVIATVLFPRVAAEFDPQGRFTVRVARHTAFIMLFVCLAAVPFSFSLPLLYGPRFASSTIQLLILLPGTYLLGLESVIVQHFTGTGLPSTIPIFWLVVIGFNLALNVLIIPSYGGTGAAISSTLSYALIFGLVAMYFRAKTGNGLSAALILKREEVRQLVMPAWLKFFSE